ncbi:serine hydrolase domain-containing protein [Marinigracilibium pacificum]|uniref:Serine hydrolase n=1 Tax=Marinigracilibium pacificum TaxID=2729599 RepID=A0A848IY42_9BACT|nr:serine hydrolase [Marinigracilibium pacificum]NMM48556.1 serine hydrolase [Marinigracilibium pacificum]
MTKFNTALFVSISLLYTNITAQSFNEFEYASPSQKGFSEAKLDSLSHFLESAGSSSLLILVDGKIVYEFGDTKKVHTIHSIRKAMLNSLYGIAISEGIIDTTETLEELGIDDIPPNLTKEEKQATVADLLKSRSGVYHNAAAVSEGMLARKPERGSHKQGEFYYYNNWDFNVLGYILEKKTGAKIFDLFLDQIANPIGMEYYHSRYDSIDGESEEFRFPDTDGFYQFEKSKSLFPAYHFRLSTRDMARYGQLYLNNGNWNGIQIIPKDWIEASTQPISVYDQNYGIAYGMLWSVLMENESRKTRSFFHTGTGVHMLAIYPESNMVLVHRVDTEKDYSFHQGHFYKMINMVWDAKN